MYRFGQDIKSEQKYPKEQNSPKEQKEQKYPKEQNSPKEQKSPSKKSRIFQSIIKYLKKYNNCADCN